MSLRPARAASVAALAFLVAVSVGGRARAAEGPLVRPAPAGLSGVWTLDLALSDDPAEKMSEAAESHRGSRGGGGGGRGGFGGGGGRGGFGGGGRGGYGGGRGGSGGGGESGGAARDPGESSGTPNEMLWDVHHLVVTDGLDKDPKFVVEMGDGSNRTLFTDGRKVEIEEATGTTTIHAKRKSGKIVVDTEYPNGREVVETWELLANPRLLVVTTKISGKRGNFTFKRVWDPEVDPAPAPVAPAPAPPASGAAGH
ncbi:MAG TPA: hypothetical protein VMV60_15185 [Thermoanaerobaculia bacterium]|nr:hypothetical protein [Thermoanaerobaculia bacterium]